MAKGRPSLAEMFWRNTDKRGPDECWPWKACVSAQGYGSLRHGKRHYQATHVALALAGKDKIPWKPFALHSCDNRVCVNPGHLRWGDHKDNYADAVERNPFLHHKPDHCRRGHLVRGEGAYIRPDGRVECRTCLRAQPHRRAA